VNEKQAKRIRRAVRKLRNVHYENNASMRVIQSAAYYVRRLWSEANHRTRGHAAALLVGGQLLSAHLLLAGPDA
jgi:hypothetical protein